MPTLQAKRFILLRDLNGGADGRVWFACTLSGLVGVLKFGQLKDKDDNLSKAKERLEGEAKLWRDVWNQKDVRVISLAGDHALLMPYVKAIDLEQVKQSPELSAAVHSAIKEMASAGYYHKDLHWRHVGLLEAPVVAGKGKNRRGSKKQSQQSTSTALPAVVLFDLALVDEVSEEQAMTQMLKALKLAE